MSPYVPPSDSGYHQQADAEATKRAQAYQKQLADQQMQEKRKAAELLQAELDAEARRRASGTNQR